MEEEKPETLALTKRYHFNVAKMQKIAKFEDEKLKHMNSTRKLLFKSSI